jgi:glycosyltransferase involved in cell wall biosynthesis
MFSWHALLGGRRQASRRDEERWGGFVDSHGYMLFLVVSLVLVMNVLDALFTVLFLSCGAEELNPLVAASLESGLWTFLTMKSAVIGVCVVPRGSGSGLHGLQPAPGLARLPLLQPGQLRPGIGGAGAVSHRLYPGGRMSALRVLQILTRPNLGGPMRHLNALLRSAPWRDGTSARVLLAVGRCSADEAELADVPPDAVRIDALGPRVHPLRDRRAAAALRELMHRFRPDVVHTHTSKAGFLGRRAAVAAGVPVLAHTFHGHVLRDYYRAPTSAVIRAIERRQARRTQLLFAVSDSCRDELEELGVGAGRIRVLPPAVELRPFTTMGRAAARQALGISDDVPLVGFVGRMVPVKQPELFVAMARRLPRARAVMFGDGPLLTGLRRSHQDVVRFLGAVQDLERYLPGLDALVLTSRREGCPLAALEARACGVAVVGLDRPGIRDALDGGSCGQLVPPESGAAGLAVAVQTLLADSGRRQRCVTAGLAGLERYAPARVASALTEHYTAAFDASRATVAGGAKVTG